MAASRAVRPLVLLLAMLLTFAMAGTGASTAVAKEPDDGIADYGPPKAPPKEWSESGDTAGVTKDGKKWCIVGIAKGCEVAPGTTPGTVDICEGGANYSECSKKEVKETELKKFKKWQDKADKKASNYKDLSASIEKCLKEDELETFTECYNTGIKSHPTPKSSSHLVSLR